MPCKLHLFVNSHYSFHLRIANVFKNKNIIFKKMFMLYPKIQFD